MPETSPAPHAVERISENFFAVKSFATQAAALIQFSQPRDIVVNDIQKISYKGHKEGIPIRFWGKDNNLPHYREQLIADNNIVAILLQTKRDINFGTGPFAYKKMDVSDDGRINIKEVPMPDDAAEFFDRNNIEDYFLDSFKNEFIHCNIFTEFTRTNELKIDRIVNHDCKYVRLGEQNDLGKIINSYVSGSWATKEYQKEGICEYDREIFPVPMYNGTNEQIQFMLHTGDRFLNDGYYNSPTWFGSREWIELANLVPQWHLSNIKNGYTIRFHIQIPKGFFDVQAEGSTPEAIAKAKKSSDERKKQFTDDVNDILAGVSGAGRTLFTTYDVTNILGKKWPGVIIEPINVDIKDSAMLELFDKTNTAIISAQGIHQTLANIETAGKLSSGSEMRNAFNVYEGTKTTIPRKNILKAINLVKKINRWNPEIFFGFGSPELTTLDENPTGINKDAVVPAEASSKAA